MEELLSQLTLVEDPEIGNLISAARGCPVCTVSDKHVIRHGARRRGFVPVVELLSQWKHCVPCSVIICCLGTRKYLVEENPVEELEFGYAAYFVECVPTIFLRMKRRDGSISPWWQLYSLPESPARIKGISEMTNISEDTSSEEALKWVMARLVDCEDTHDNCRIGPTATPPARILDIWGSLNICCTDNFYAEYACLSHCWGSSLCLKTTKDNLAEFQKCIDFNRLPKTFQDAVIFLRRLHIQYLWIDALCIIQDDPEDWRRESAKMASIYQGALLTIAASRSADGNSGCFCQPTKDEIGFEVMPKWGLYMRQRIAHPDFISCQLDENSASSSVQGWVHESKLPLLKRGWVLQERLLSPRFLHFGTAELIWECMESTDCQCSGIRIKRFASRETKQKFRDNLSTMTQSELENLWQDTVRSYTTLDLTYHFDRLPAIAGLASHIQKFRQDRYFHGMWEQSILRDLLWAVSQDTLRQRPAGVTWSWATVNSGIWYPRTNDSNVPVKVFCKVVQLPLPPSTLTEGEDQAPVLRLSGPVIAADHRIHYQADASEDPGYSYHCVYVGDDWSICYPDYPWYAKGPDRLEDSEQIHVLKISEEGRFWSALVMKCLCHKTGEYKRIGVIHTSISDILKGFEGVEDRVVNLT